MYILSWINLEAMPGKFISNVIKLSQITHFRAFYSQHYSGLMIAYRIINNIYMASSHGAN